MYKVSVNNSPEIEVKLKDGLFLIDDKPSDFDIVTNTDGSYHALYQGKSYKINVLEEDAHSLTLKINNKKTTTRIKNDLEDLLTKMGMDKLAGNAMNELKAPMPGMVLKIMVNTGDEVKKGDSLIVLEAMKMENNIKALGDGIVSEISINAGDKVEKNQVLMRF